MLFIEVLTIFSFQRGDKLLSSKLLVNKRLFSVFIKRICNIPVKIQTSFEEN